MTVWSTLDPQPYAAHFVALSNGNLTATGTGAAIAGTGSYPYFCAALGVAQALEGKTSGKEHIEVICNAASGYDDAIGITGPLCSGVPFQPGSFALGNQSADNSWLTASSLGYRQDGDINKGRFYLIGQYPSRTWGPWGTGDRIAMDINHDDAVMWWRVNGGPYLGLTDTGDPSDLSSGMPIFAAGTPVRPAVSFARGGQYTFNFGASAFLDSVPAGYSGSVNTGLVNLGSYLSNAIGGFFNTGGSVIVSPYVAGVSGPVNNLMWAANDSATGPEGYGVLFDSDGIAGAPHTLLGVSSTQALNDGFGQWVARLAATFNAVEGHTYYPGIFIIPGAPGSPTSVQVGGNVADLWVDATATYPDPNPTFTISSTPNFHLPIMTDLGSGGGGGGGGGFTQGQII